jgi:hypothetical protein
VERWFGKITTERIRRGTFTSMPEPERAIYDYIEHNIADPNLSSGQNLRRHHPQGQPWQGGPENAPVGASRPIVNIRVRHYTS